MTLKKLTTLFITILLIYTVPTFASEYEVKPTDIKGEGAVLINQESGQVLFDKNAHSPYYPASTTKILTAIIILEDLPLNETVIVDERSPFAGGSSIALEPGETLTVEQLVYALIIASANDVAEALAIHHSGSIEAFKDVMNTRAAALGAINSNFENPHGLPNDDHLSTAYDLAMITKYAMQNEIFKTIVATRRYEIPPTNIKKDTRYLNSTNSFFEGMAGSNLLITVRDKKVPISYPYVTGVKRGYTEAAQNCFVGSATIDDKSYISVVLKSIGNDMYQDSRLLLDLGMFGTQSHVLNESFEVIETISLNNKRKTQIPTVIESRLVVDLPENQSIDALEKKIVFNTSIDLPIKKGEVLGTLSYYSGDQLLVSTPLVSQEDFAGEDLVTEVTRFLMPQQAKLFSRAWFINVFVRLVVALLLWRSIMTYIKVQKIKRKKRISITN